MTFPLIFSGVHDAFWIKQAQKKFKNVYFMVFWFLYKRFYVGDILKEIKFAITMIIVNFYMGLE
jgi:hypothetical protein